MKYQAQKGRLVSLGVAGQINTWSPALEPISSVSWVADAQTLIELAIHARVVTCLRRVTMRAVSCLHHVQVWDMLWH